MLDKVDGIVLRILKHTDKVNIVDLYTKEYGRRSYIVSLPKSKRSKVRHHLLQPLSLIQIICSLRSKSSLPRINEINILYPYRTIPYNPSKASIAFFLAEFLYRVLRDETSSPTLFSYLLHSLQWLDRADKNIANYHILFLIRFTRFIGLYPNVEDYEEGKGFFDMMSANFSLTKPLMHNHYLNSKESKVLLFLTRLNYESMHRLTLTRDQRNRCIELIEKYYRLHLPSFPPFRTLSVLKEIFD